MGLENRENGKFITIYGGKLSIKVDQGTEGAVTRVNKEGKTVHEKYYNSFTGKLIGIKTQDSSYGKNWLFSFQDEQDVYNLTLSYSNSYASNFLKKLPNIDVTKEMKIQPSMKEVDGKSKSSLFVTQDGVSIKHAYTRENPNEMPEMEQITVKGQLTWDDTKQINFLHDMVMRDIVPKLPQRVETTEKSSGLSVEATEPSAEDIDL